MSNRIRIGSRQSPLALKQARIVADRLIAQSPDWDCEIVPIETQGDVDKITPLALMGGKGVFVKALEVALLEQAIDIGVHSLKDFTSALTPGLTLSSFLEAETIADVMILKKPAVGLDLSDLPKGLCIGTSSLRRKALLKYLRPDFKCIDIRGNIGTRIEKLHGDEMDGIILSHAGLIRMGIANENLLVLPEKSFFPAPGQGVIALQIRENDNVSETLSRSINNEPQEALSRVELALLADLGFDCNAPFGVFTQIENNMCRINAFVASPDLTEFVFKEHHYNRVQTPNGWAELGTSLKEVINRWV
ncbi:MAG: hydroxymethylbilane synthase [Candidatus Marinamargulisbacteria bacterium]|jgi:hydroxymethylbilane synthase